MMKYVDLDLVYPVGSIYFSANGTNPREFFGGEWVQIEDKFLLCAGSTYGAGTTGGEATHTLVNEELPVRTLFSLQNNTGKELNASGSSEWVAATVATGKYFITCNQDAKTAGLQDTNGGAPHNNMPPYLAVYVFQRIS